MSLISIISPTFPPRAIAQPSVPDSYLQASRMVEDLFQHTPPTCWDSLLDLRQALIHDGDSKQWLPLFQQCQRLLEEDHYLPFYRMRRVLQPTRIASGRTS